MFAFAGGLPCTIKYDDLSTGSDNFIVLRFAEMYLIRAEATARQNGDLQKIKDDLNTIRFRANLPGTAANSYASLLTAIEEERRLEFAFEGHRCSTWCAPAVLWMCCPRILRQPNPVPDSPERNPDQYQRRDVSESGD